MANVRLSHVNLTEDRVNAAFARLDAAERIIDTHGLEDLRSIVLYVRAKTAIQAGEAERALAAVMDLKELGTPVAEHHRKEASLAYIQAFPSTGGVAWHAWGIGIGGGLLVLGLAAGAVAQGYGRSRLPVLLAGALPDGNAVSGRLAAWWDALCRWVMGPAGSEDLRESSDAEDGGSPPPIHEITRYERLRPDGPNSSIYVRERFGPERLTWKGGSGDAEAEVPTPERKHLNVDDVEPVTRMDPKDADALTREVPTLGDGHRGRPPQLDMSEEEASDEHRRILFALWGIPPNPTAQYVRLPLYMADGTYVGTRGVPADVIQEQLAQSLLLRLVPGGAYELDYLRPHDATTVLRTISHRHVTLERLEAPIRGFPLTYIPRAVCNV